MAGTAQARSASQSTTPSVTHTAPGSSGPERRGLPRFSVGRGGRPGGDAGGGAGALPAEQGPAPGEPEVLGAPGRGVDQAPDQPDRTAAAELGDDHPPGQELPAVAADEPGARAAASGRPRQRRYPARAPPAA